MKFLHNTSAITECDVYSNYEYEKKLDNTSELESIMSP